MGFLTYWAILPVPVPYADAIFLTLDFAASIASLDSWQGSVVQVPNRVPGMLLMRSNEVAKSLKVK